jgi:hypothetical protein
MVRLGEITRDRPQWLTESESLQQHRASLEEYSAIDQQETAEIEDGGEKETDGQSQEVANLEPT